MKDIQTDEEAEEEDQQRLLVQRSSFSSDPSLSDYPTSTPYTNANANANPSISPLLSKPSSSTATAISPSPSPPLPSAIITILVVVAVDVLSFMVIMPIIDTFCQSLGAPKSLVGLQFTVYSSAAILSSLILGRVSDSTHPWLGGRKNIFLFSAMGAIVAALGCILLTTFTEFLMCTALSGFCTGTVGTAYAYIGDIVGDNDKERTRYFAYVTATLSMCFVIGPFFGGMISSLWSIRSPFYFSASIAVLELFLVMKFLKNPKELQREREYHAVLLNEQQFEDDKKSTMFAKEFPSSSITGASSSTETTPSPIHRPETEEAKTVSRASSFSEIMITSTPNVIANPLDLSSEMMQSRDTDDIFQAIDDEQLLKSLFYIPPTDTDEEVGFTRKASYTGLVIPQERANSTHSLSRKQPYAPSHPWFDYRALWVGGLGTALNTTTYLGIIALLPLILEESRYGIVDGNNNNNTAHRILSTIISTTFSILGGVVSADANDDDDITTEEIKTISRYMGYYLGCYGFTQVLGMVGVFPHLSKRIGILYTGVVGSIIFGSAFFVIFLTNSPNQMFAVCIPMAFGNSLCRPIFPSYLGSIATKERRAEYMAISATFGNVALMIGGQMTYLYSTYSREMTIILCGGASIINALLLLIFAIFHPQK